MRLNSMLAAATEAKRCACGGAPSKLRKLPGNSTRLNIATIDTGIGYTPDWITLGSAENKALQPSSGGCLTLQPSQSPGTG
jgi:hypothetical protein